MELARDAYLDGRWVAGSGRFEVRDPFDNALVAEVTDCNHADVDAASDAAARAETSRDVLWWSKGGVLKGHSQERIKFLRGSVESAPGYLKPSVIFPSWMPFSSVTYNNEYFLAYFNMDQPRSMVLNLPVNSEFNIEVIDAWNMTIKQVPGKFKGRCLVELPQKPMTAIRVTKIK
jgi:hypothetical protein